MHWTTLTSIDQIPDINSHSANKPQLIFKHSTTCSISNMALNRFERQWSDAPIDCYLLDLLKYRDVSNKVAQQYAVHHESPQVLLIKNGECIYDESHNAITVDDIIEQANL